jgi:hypothetical protein
MHLDTSAAIDDHGPAIRAWCNLGQGDAMAIDPALISAQARIFEDVVGYDGMSGFLDDLARRFEVAPSDFLTCLDGLLGAGWIAVTIDLEHRLSIRLEV